LTWKSKLLTWKSNTKIGENMNGEYNLQAGEPENIFKDPNEPTIPEPNVPETPPSEPDPYPVTDPISEPIPEPTPFPTTPEPIPTLPPDVVF
jgi:hypothetical protein